MQLSPRSLKLLKSGHGYFSSLKRQYCKRGRGHVCLAPSPVKSLGGPKNSIGIKDSPTCNKHKKRFSWKRDKGFIKIICTQEKDKSKEMTKHDVLYFLNKEQYDKINGWVG